MTNNICFELKKILKSKIFIFSILALFLINGLVIYYSNKNYIDNNQNKSSIININKDEYKNYKYYSSYKQYKYQYNTFLNKKNKEKDINNYILDKEINTHKKTKNIFEKNIIILVFIMLPISIISSNLYSSEINSGTMKTILVRPYNRIKIFLSKIIVINIICLTLILLNILFSSFFTLIFTKENIFSFAEIVNVNKIKLINYFLSYFLNYFIISIPVFFICNLSLILSFITSSTAISSGICIFLSLISLSISEFLFLLKMKFVQYTFLPYLDFTIFKEYTDVISFNINYGINLNVSKGILVLLVHVILLYLIVYANFRKKDIN
jgi:ABC-2 type transport system permease protein